MARYIVACLVVLACSCSAPEQVSSHKFLDIDSLITEQVAMLSRARFKLDKKAGIGDQQEEVVVTPDSTGWSNELAVFRQLQLAERPTHREKYTVSDAGDVRSNLKVRSYVARKSEDGKETPVPYIHLFYLDALDDIRRIEAGYYESNLLYTSKRDLVLEFEDSNGPNALKRYRIDGYQKVMMADSVHFSVDAEVIF